MARTKKEDLFPEEEAPKAKKGSIDILESYLKENKDDHYNFIQEKDYTVSTGSLIFDIELGGGVRPSILRACGVSGGGKTSSSLAMMLDFLKEKKGRKALYVKSEGRLSKEITERSGAQFVDTPEAWAEGTCFVFKTNVYETTANLIRTLVENNPENTSYFFIIDSMDALIPKGDKAKLFEESGKVGGGATISSHFLRTMALPFSVGGHVCVMISQVRSSISINPYAKTDPKLTNASGGNALLHYSDWILEFQPRYSSDVIEDSKGKTVGHWAKVIFRKSPNEKEGQVVRYPIKHGQKGGNSVWKEYELCDLLISWEMFKKNGAWLAPTEEIIKEVFDGTGEEIPPKIQGMGQLMMYLENNQVVTNFLFEKFKKLLAREE